MRRELILGGLVSAGFHLAFFLAPWSLVPKTEILWVPKPELEISFLAPVQKEDDSSRGSSPTQLATSQEKPEPLYTFPENLEPSIPKTEKSASSQHFSKPKAKPRPEGKKQEAQAKRTSPPQENTSVAHVPSDSSPIAATGSNQSQEVQSVPGKEEKRTGLESPQDGNASPKARLKKALPRYGSNPAPVYPEAARRRGYEGKVILSVLVLKDGSPQSVRVVKGSGYKILDDAATEAVASWKFIPAFLGEEPVEMEVEVPILFKLE